MKNKMVRVAALTLVGIIGFSWVGLASAFSSRTFSIKSIATDATKLRMSNPYNANDPEDYDYYNGRPSYNNNRRSRIKTNRRYNARAASRRDDDDFDNDFYNDTDDEERGVATQVRPLVRPMVNGNGDEQDDFLNQETFGGYTVKQRLREEVEFPFRTVRLVFFGSSTGSALTALYFSLLSTIKAYVGGYSDAPPLEQCLQNDAINLGAAVLCAYLTYRDWKAGQGNLQRIAKGGKLASLQVEPMAPVLAGQVFTLSDYRRQARVLICAGGSSYLRRLALSLTSDQLSDTNILPRKLADTDVLVVPVLLDNDDLRPRDTQSYWKNMGQYMNVYDEAYRPELVRNFDISRAQEIIAFPRGSRGWQDYLQNEVETALAQGFDVLEQGITITVKKNGKILRRATGIPPWGELIATLEVADGSRFGMPGDSSIYGER